MKICYLQAITNARFVGPKGEGSLDVNRDSFPPFVSVQRTDRVRVVLPPRHLVRAQHSNKSKIATNLSFCEDGSCYGEG